MKTILLAFLTLFTFSVQAQKNATNIQLAKGQKISVEIKNDSDTDLGMGMNLTNKSENTSVLTVIGETDKEYTLSNTLTKLKLSVEGMGQSQEFDSEKESDKNTDMGKALGDAIGKSVEVYVSKLTGSPTYKPGNDGPEKPASNPVENMMSALGGQEPSVGGAFLLIPAGKKAGDSWKDADTSNGKNGSTIYTIKSVSGNVAEISFTSDMVAETNLDANGTSMPVKMNVKSTGEVTTDLSTGLVSKRTSVSDIDGTMEIQGQTIPLTVKNNTSIVYTLLKN